MTGDEGMCPSATGVPQQPCPVNGHEHRCMRPRPTHPLHTCHCGSHWVCSTSQADLVTKPQPGPQRLVWVDPGGRVWAAPLGTPPPGDPMPAAWVLVRRPPA